MIRDAMSGDDVRTRSRRNDIEGVTRVGSSASCDNPKSEQMRRKLSE